MIFWNSAIFMEVQMRSLAAAKITEEEIGEFQALIGFDERGDCGGADLKTRQYYNNLFHFPGGEPFLETS